jgi:Protein of unknown function (DUF3105)
MPVMKPWIAALAALTFFTACNRPDEGIADLETFTVVRDHKEGRLSYDTNPPTGGIHNPAWQNCGIYDQQIALENAVHSLEHGAVWLTYQPDLPSDQVQKLRELAKGRGYTLLSPYLYGALEKPIYAVAWGLRVGVDKADDPRLPKFIQKYMNGPQTPELGAACTGAIGSPIDK